MAISQDEIISEQSNIEAYKQLLGKSESRLQELEQERETVLSRIAELEAQKEAVHTIVAERKASVDLAKRTYNDLQEQSAMASEYLEIAKGTSLEQSKQDAWQELVFAQNNASKELDKLQYATQEQDDLSGRELRKLDGEIHPLHSKVRSLTQQLSFARRSRDAVFTQLGQSLYADYVSRLEQAHDTLASLELQLSIAREKLDDLSIESLTELQPYSTLQEDIKSRCTSHDPAIEILQAFLYFQMLMLEKGYGVHTMLENTLYASTPFRALAELLDLTQDDMNHCFYRITPPLHIQERVKMCNQVLAMYIQEKLK